MEKDLNCQFCSIENSEDQNIVFRNDLVLFAQAPKFQGTLKHSGIIIPIAHRQDVFELTMEEINATFELLKEVKNWMDKNICPQGYNLGWNCGKIAGQKIFHAHLHVIPRFEQEPLAGKGIRSHLKSDANKWS